MDSAPLPCSWPSELDRGERFQNGSPPVGSIQIEMGRRLADVLYVVAMVAVIVGVDFAFFRNRFWERLTVNIGIVLVLGAFYFRFLRRP